MSNTTPACSVPLFPTPGEQKEREIAAIDAVRSELQQTRQDFAQYKADQDEQRRDDLAKADLKEKKIFHQQLKLSAFTVCLTLALEHIGDVIDFINLMIRLIVSLFQ